MTSIQVDEDTAKVLTEMATAHRMTVPELLRSLAVRGVATEPDALAADFDEELESLLFDGPTLPSDFSRADLYQDHD
jgi:hypothetical protein